MPHQDECPHFEQARLVFYRCLGTILSLTLVSLNCVLILMSAEFEKCQNDSYQGRGIGHNLSILVGRNDYHGRTVLSGLRD